MSGYQQQHDHAAWMNSHESRPADWKPRHEREEWDLPGNLRTTKPMNRTPRDILIFVMGLLAGLGAGKCVFGQTPASELRAAGRDAMTVGAQAPSCFWLTMYAVPPERREELEKQTNDALNKLSRSRNNARALRVTDTLLRVSVWDYATSADDFKAWMAAKERVAELSDYTFHIRTQIAEANNVIAKVGSPLAVANPAKLKAVTVDGGWIDVVAAAKLRAMTGQFATILRADWFVANALNAPAIYEFNGTPVKEEDFLKSIGIDPALYAKLRVDTGANLIRSGVTKKERRILEVPGPLGGLWTTLDIVKNSPDKSFIRRPISAEGYQADFDASEVYWVGPNGHLRVAVFNRQGQRQNEVDPHIAIDDNNPHGTGVILVGTSCYACHKEGLRPFTDTQRDLLVGRVGLDSYDPGIPARALEFYNSPRLLRQMKFDLETYAAAVQESSGQTIRESSDGLEHVVTNHDYLDVTKEQACREIGVTPTQFDWLVSNIKNDPMLHLLAKGTPISRDTWVSSFAVVALAAESNRGNLR